jgi:hypothetical protein
VVTPATSKPANLIDNIAGGTGPLPDGAMLRRMEQFIAALPEAR